MVISYSHIKFDNFLQKIVAMVPKKWQIAIFEFFWAFVPPKSGHN